MMRIRRRKDEGALRKLVELKKEMNKDCSGDDKCASPSCVTHCKKCNSGHFEECNKCNNMLCGVRGDRFMVDKKHSHLERRLANVDYLVDIEDCLPADRQ